MASPEAIKNSGTGKSLGLTIGGLALVFLLGSGPIVNGAILGLLMCVGIWAVLVKAPGICRRCKEHPLASDAIFTVGSFFIIKSGGQLTALVASVVVGIGFSAALALAHGGFKWKFWKDQKEWAEAQTKIRQCFKEIANAAEEFTSDRRNRGGGSDADHHDRVGLEKHPAQEEGQVSHASGVKTSEIRSKSLIKTRVTLEDIE